MAELRVASFSVPAGESPVRVSAGAPGSRPPATFERLVAEEWRQKPLGRDRRRVRVANLDFPRSSSNLALTDINEVLPGFPWDFLLTRIYSGHERHKTLRADSGASGTVDGAVGDDEEGRAGYRD